MIFQGLRGSAGYSATGAAQSRPGRLTLANVFVAISLLGLALPAQAAVDAEALARFAIDAGRKIGRASSCKEVLLKRVESDFDKVMALIRDVPSKSAQEAILKSFSGSIQEGANAKGAQADNCATMPETLTQIEAATLALQNPAQPAPSTLAQMTGPAATELPKPTPPPVVAPPAPLPVGKPAFERELRFGMVGPFSGPSRELGRQMKIGIQTAFDAANAAGGVNGAQLKLETGDDGYEPARTVDAMKALRETSQVVGFIGNVGTPTTAAALPYALENRMLFFGAFTGANLLRRDPPDRYVFNYRASYSEETDAVVRYLVKTRHLQTDQIAVFAQQDAFGDAGFEGVERAARALGRTARGPMLRFGYARNTLEVGTAVAALAKAKSRIKAVVMVATYRAAAKFIEKTRNEFPDMIYTNVSFVGSTALSEELMLLGPKYASKVIVTQVVPAVEGYSSTILDYKAALEKSFAGERPDYVSLEGYISAKILIEAIKRAGRIYETDKVVAALEAIKDLDLGLGTNVTFGPSEHQGSHKVWGTQIDEKGKYAPLDLQ